MRSMWPLPPDEELKSHIDNSHQISIDEKLERYKFIWQEFGPPEEMLIVGGTSAFLALEELRLCFVEGYFLAVILLAQVYIENSLGGNYIVSGDDRIAEKGFAHLINRSEEDSFIASKMAKSLHELRLMRNPYVHPKAGLGSRTLMKRILESYEIGKPFTSPQEFAKDDAEKAIQILVDFLRDSRIFGASLNAPTN